ncbi:serine hydrolase domain-containing protein [Pedobacter sp.]|uniref:serine hydrolase domain-containing protein n=1 Tax=Pedobacter sp. TaxID=1411316 RepID=UPI003BAA51E8
MKNIFNLLYCILFISLSSCKSYAQQENHYKAQIDSLIQNKTPRSFNGVILIVQNGKTNYEKAYGYTNFDKKTKLKIPDRFSTMSIAKQVTATLVLQEVQNGTIDLQVPIRKYLPNFKYKWADTVTMHQLLNNTSGLFSEQLDRPLKFKPGTAFNYSNIGYYVAGLVLEKQSGKSFEQLVTAIFNKCKMNNSAYPTELTSKLLVKGHTIKKEGTVVLNEKLSMKPIDYFGSHLIVSAPDLAKWNNCLHNGALLKPEAYNLMTSYTITDTHKVFSENPIGYGYGLRINDKADIFEIGHTGFHPNEGYTAVNLYYPKRKTSVIVIENQAFENFDIAYYFEQEIRKIVMKSTLLK